MPTQGNEIYNEQVKIPAQRLADLILDMGTYLLSSGAHCGRLNSNLSRIANIWGFDINLDPTFKGLLVKVRDRHDVDNTVTSFREAPPHSVHLSILTDISHLAWETHDNNLSISEVEERFERIKKQPSYSKWTTAIAIGFSCAGLCFFSFGDIYNALVAMLGASLGFLVKARFDKMQFNAMISIIIAAFVTTLVTAGATLLDIGKEPQSAMATAVLYLIPGVPLLNCVIDLIEGYLSSAINRALFGGFILLCIAVGMTLCITMMGISNFK